MEWERGLLEVAVLSRTRRFLNAGVTPGLQNPPEASGCVRFQGSDLPYPLLIALWT